MNSGKKDDRGTIVIEMCIIMPIVITVIYGNPDGAAQNGAAVGINQNTQEKIRLSILV